MWLKCHVVHDGHKMWMVFAVKYSQGCQWWVGGVMVGHDCRGWETSWGSRFHPFLHMSDIGEPGSSLHFLRYTEWLIYCFHNMHTFCSDHNEMTILWIPFSLRCDLDLQQYTHCLYYVSAVHFYCSYIKIITLVAQPHSSSAGDTGLVHPRNLHVLPLLVWVPAHYSSFLLQPSYGEMAKLSLILWAWSCVLRCTASHLRCPLPCILSRLSFRLSTTWYWESNI